MNESEEMRGRLPHGMFTALRDELNMFLAETDPFLVDDDGDEISEYMVFLTETIERHKATYKDYSRGGKVHAGPPILQPWDEL